MDVSYVGSSSYPSSGVNTTQLQNAMTRTSMSVRVGLTAARMDRTRINTGTGFINGRVRCPAHRG